MGAKVENYPEIIQTILTRYEEILNQKATSGRETELVCDTNHDHYMLNTVGWNGKERIWHTIVYVRLREGKIWIEVDNLEDGIASDLVEAGVPKNDIVLAFHHPSLRPLTEFASS